MTFRRSAVSISTVSSFTLSIFTLSSFTLSILAASLMLAFVGCGGSKSSTTTPPPTITVAFPGTGQQYAPPTSLATSATAQIAATVTNDSQNLGVTWSCTPASTCGSFNATTTASGAATTYTAPASVPSGNTVTITATSVASSSAFAHATITITSTPVITVTFPTSGQYVPPTSLAVSATAQIAAIVTNDSQNLGVTWSCTPASACGSFSATSTASGAPTTYTAPATVPSGNTVTITATSVASSSAFASTAITITSTPTITVAFPASGQQYAPPTSMATSGTAQIAAIVSNDSQNLGVTWSCTPVSVCGSFNPSSTASGAPTTYTAPATAPSGGSVTITATSVASSSAFASATITIGIVVTFTSGFAPPSSMNVGATAHIAATVTNDSSNEGVDWSCTPVAACGTFNPSHTNTNVDTAYTAPATVPSGGTVTVTATSTADPTKSVTSSPITITQPITTLVDGTYVFQVAGEDNNSLASFYVAGAFTVVSGAITGGEQDFIDSFNLSYGNDPIATDSTITKTTDGNLQLVLDTQDSSLGVNGLETLNVALVTTSSGLVTWFDSFASGTGTLTAQTSAAQTAPLNGYAFLASGLDSNGDTNAIGGVVNVNASGAISSSVFDNNDGGGILQNQTFDPTLSSVTAPVSYGRVVFTLVPTGNSDGEIDLVGYIVNASVVELVETSDPFSGTMGGTALAQVSGTFSNSSLSGTSYVVGAQGGDVNGDLDFAGSLSFNGNNSVTGTASFNDTANTASLSAVSGGTYAVDATGRVTVTGLTGSGLNNPNISGAPRSNGPQGSIPTATLQFYIDGNGNALMATMDPNDTTSGPAFRQASGATFAGSYALGAVGLGANGLWSAVGPANISSGAVGTGSFTDFDYFNDAGTDAVPTADVALTGTAAASGGTLTGLDADTPADSDPFDFYVIDNFRAFGIETDLTQLGLLYFQQAPSLQQSKRSVKSHK